MDIHLVSYYVGIFIIFLSNIYVLIYTPSYKMMIYNAYVNILGAFLIAYYFIHKEGFIKF